MFDQITQGKFDKLSQDDKERFNKLLKDYHESLSPSMNHRSVNDPTIRVMQSEVFMKLTNAVQAIKTGTFATNK